MEGCCVQIKSGGEQTVKAMLKDERPVLILYHMNMCPHCQVLKPTWDKVKKKLKTNSGIITAEVEFADMNMLPVQLRQIRGFPTIQVLHRGKVKQEYFGDRSLTSITDFAMQHVKTAEPKKKSTSAKKTKKPAVNKT